MIIPAIVQAIVFGVAIKCADKFASKDVLPITSKKRFFRLALVILTITAFVLFAFAFASIPIGYSLLISTCALGFGFKRLAGRIPLAILALCAWLGTALILILPWPTFLIGVYESWTRDRQNILLACSFLAGVVSLFLTFSEPNLSTRQRRWSSALALIVIAIFWKAGMKWLES